MPTLVEDHTFVGGIKTQDVTTGSFDSGSIFCGDVTDGEAGSISAGNVLSGGSGTAGNIIAGNNSTTGLYGFLQGSSLVNSSNLTIFDLDADVIFDTIGQFSVGADGRILYGSTGLPVFDWGNGIIYDPTEVEAINVTSRLLTTSVATNSLDWENSQLLAAGGSVIVMDWSVQQSFDATNLLSHDWNTRTLYDAAATPLSAIVYGTRELLDHMENASFAWGSRLGTDSGGHDSFDYENRLLLDATATPQTSVNWFSRLLQTNAGVVNFNWANAGLILGAPSTTPTHSLNTQLGTPGIGVALITNLPTGIASVTAKYIQITINGTTGYIPFFS